MIYTIKDISDQLKITPAYIHKCIKGLDVFLSGNIEKGENGRYEINTFGFDIFRRIATLKAGGASLREIKKDLEKSGVKSTMKTGIETGVKQVQSADDGGVLSDLREYIADLKQERDKLREKTESHEQEIRELQEVKMALQGRILAIESTAEQREKMEKAEKIKKVKLNQLVSDLGKCKFFQAGKKKKILAEIAELTK